MNAADAFGPDISRYVWETRYRSQPGDRGIEDTWQRVSNTLAAVESDRARRDLVRADFQRILGDFRFIPGGRILAGAGTSREVTLFNCFVMGTVQDSLDGIFTALREGALTMQQGGGVGYDFSSLRPHGSPARRVGAIASGPVSFMRIWDSMCATLVSTGNRRGAMMATLRCDHPDIEAFIDAKRQPAELRHFNLSVQISDAFMEAVAADAEWPLLFPALPGESGPRRLSRWPGFDAPVPCRVFGVLKARGLWERLIRASYRYAEPGVLFIDRINRMNNLWYREYISATNPCGEIPLPPYGACDLGSINLARFVDQPFTTEAELDLRAIRDTVQTAVHLLDNVIDASRFPLPQQREQIEGSRRIGLGIAGLADCLLMLGLRYGEERGYDLAARLMREICYAAYRASIALAAEKGPFPFLDQHRYLQGAFVRSLPRDIRQGIARQGIRNSHLLAIAPTGTISLLAGNISSGLEPVFEYAHRRRIFDADDRVRTFEVTDYAYRLWRSRHPDAPLPRQFVTARELPPTAHLRMQAVLQPHVDNAISKTINVPADIDFPTFQAIYREAYRLGLKGCTTFRANPVTGEVMIDRADHVEGAPCCTLERKEEAKIRRETR